MREESKAIAKSVLGLYIVVHGRVYSSFEIPTTAPLTIWPVGGEIKAGEIHDWTVIDVAESVG